MYKCCHCHKPNPKKASFCGHCGLKIKNDNCDVCKKPFDPKLTYCIHCGVKPAFLRSGNNLKASHDLIYKLIKAQKESNKLQNKALIEIVRLLCESRRQGSELSSTDMALLKDRLQSGQTLPAKSTEQSQESPDAQSTPQVPAAEPAPVMPEAPAVEPAPVTPEAPAVESAPVAPEANGAETTQDKATKPVSNLGERRELTVLFSDLSGYTAMNERLDPEDVEDIMQEVIKRGTAIVEEYEGIVNLIVGDELVVLFGIPDAHEDDSFRAVTVALNFHAMIHEYSKTIEKKHGIKLDLHTGIHSGMVVTKHQDSHAGKYNITGDTVNTAARLLGAAETGAILISPRVEHSVEGYFNLEKLEPVAMKGKAKKMTPYKVISATGASSRIEASEHKGLTDFIGRKSELEQFAMVLEVVLQGKGQVISIIGDGGIGKSRLIHEFSKQLDDTKFKRVRGGCHEGKSQAYQPFVEIMRSIFKLSTEDDDASSVVKIEKSIKQINPKLEVGIPFIVICYPYKMTNIR